MNPQPPYLETLVEQLDVAFLVIGPGLLVNFATAAAERLLAASEGSLVGITMDQLLPVERRGELKNFEDVLAGGGGRRLRSALRLTDGRRIDVSLTLAPLLDHSGRIAAVSARYEPARSSAQWVRASLAPARSSSSPAGSLPAGEGTARSVPPRPRVAPSSEQRLTPSRPATGVHARLAELEVHLRWLEDRLSSPASIAPLDDPRERARALLVVGEARDLTEQCRQALEGDSPSSQPIPAPPKLPRM